MTALDTPPPKKRDLTRDIVAGGSLPSYYDQARRALPPVIDDLTGELGDDLYERMLNDAQVAACINVLRSATLENGVVLRPAVDDADADGYDQSKELVARYERMLDGLELPLDDVLWDMLRALALGSRVAEQVYAYDSTYTGRSLLALQALKVKPRRATAFVVDPYGSVQGLLGAKPGQTAVSENALPSGAEVIERAKFAVFSFRPKDNDPRGSTLLRTAYNAWNLKQQIIPEWFKYLVQFASASLVGKTAPDALDSLDADGNIITPQQRMLNELLAFRNGTAIALAAGEDLDLLFSQGNGKAFLEAFAWCDKQITIAVTSQTRAMMESQFGSRADSETGQDLLDTFVRQLKKSVCAMMRRDVLSALVRYNDGARLLPLTPYASLGETEQQDLAGLMNAVAALNRASYLDPSQYAGIDEQLNLPPRVAGAAPAAGKPTSPPAPDAEESDGAAAGETDEETQS